jgi:hypothetical protein
MAKWNNWYYDTNAGEAVSLAQLKTDYEQFKAESPDDYARYPDFDSYMNACMVRSNGSLAPIHELAENDVVTFLDADEAVNYINEAAVKYGISETEKTRLLDLARDFYS